MELECAVNIYGKGGWKKLIAYEYSQIVFLDRLGTKIGLYMKIICSRRPAFHLAA